MLVPFWYAITGGLFMLAAGMAAGYILGRDIAQHAADRRLYEVRNEDYREYRARLRRLGRRMMARTMRN